MTTQSGACWQITFSPLPHTPEELTNFLDEYFEVLVCNLTNDEQEEQVGYCQTPIDEQHLRESAKLWNINLPSYKIEFIPATNWLTKNVIEFDPIETTDFIIYGSHQNTIPTSNKLAIQIYAATAFGSGEHQTTFSCLELLSKLNKQGFEASSILDMGCGSGILALAGLKLWDKSQANAVDIDSEAVIVAMQNAQTNGLSNRLVSFQSNGYQSQEVTSSAPYDLIFANILARPLIDMAPDLAKNLKDCGFCILSGFIDEQTDWVIRAHTEHNLSLVATYQKENWIAVLMEKAV